MPARRHCANAALSPNLGGFDAGGSAGSGRGDASAAGGKGTSGATGTAGASGTGGVVRNGGSTGAGGTTAPCGTTGPSGATGTGGSTGTGGGTGMQVCPSLPGAPAGTPPLPSPAQLAHQRTEMTAFIHFGMATYDGTEQCNPSDPVSTLAPTKLDATSVGQWVTSLKGAGFRQAMLVTKHS